MSAASAHAMDTPYCSVCTMPLADLPPAAAACAGIASALTLGAGIGSPTYLAECLCDEHRALVVQLVIMIGLGAGEELAKQAEKPEPKGD